VGYSPTEGCVQKPAWSPDSQMVAFANMSEGCCDMQGADQIWVWDIERGEIRLLYQVDGETIDVNTIAWSPDGGSVAFLDGGVYYLIDADCEGGPGGCDESALTIIDRIPFEWLDTYYPQWRGATTP
jgi:dipeptidyl aminopeptidase/acylaminoacyl peptidase